MTNTANTAPDLKIDDIISALLESHSRTTQGRWIMGSQINETVARTDRGNTDVAKFRRVDDARFCDLVHAFLPRVLDEITDLREQVLDLTQKLNNYDHTDRDRKS